MDDITIIVLTLILTVVAAVSQNKKKRTQPPAGKGGDFWKYILEGEEAIPAIEPDEAKRPENLSRRNTVPESSRFQKSMATGDAEEGIRNETVEGILNRRGPETEENADHEILMEDFSLRKALVWSEILNPKYLSTD